MVAELDCTRYVTRESLFCEAPPPSHFISRAYIQVHFSQLRHAPKCAEFNIRSYPALRHFTAGDRKARVYRGGRTYPALAAFVAADLERACTLPARVDSKAEEHLCSERELEYADIMRTRGLQSIRSELRRLRTLRRKSKSKRSLTLETKRWMKQRLNVLEQLAEEGKKNDDNEKVGREGTQGSSRRAPNGARGGEEL